MNATWTLATLLCLLAPPVESAKQPETLLYVRTTPSGAEIRLGGKLLGTSDDLFGVKSGNYKIVVDLEGHQPKEQKITVRDGRITRIELQLEKDATAGADKMSAPTRLRHFVQIVVGKEKKMTFEGDKTTWEKLPALLERVPNRKHTVLAVAIASEDTTVQRRKQAVARTAGLARRFGFEYASDVGVHPLGTKGEAPHEVPVENAVSESSPKTLSDIELPPVLRVYPVTEAVAKDALTMLISIVPKAQVRINFTTRRLIAYCTPADHEKIKAALETLQKEQTPETPPRVEVYRLENVDTNSTFALLQTMLPNARLSIDPQTKDLIALAIPADHAVIKSTLDRLVQKKAGEAPSPELRFYPLKPAMPPDFLETVKKAAPGATVSLGRDGKHLMAVALPKEHDKIKKAIDGIEKARAPDGP